MSAMTRNLGAVALMAGLAMGAASPVRAQQGRGGAADAATVPLKVTVTISRFEGEKKTASLPFVLWLNTGGQAIIQMGSEVPVPSTYTKDGVPSQTYSYRPVGTNINCSAAALADGLYRLSITVEDSQVFRMPTSGVAQIGPGFQNFKAINSPMLRDGQQVQFAVATDKTSGEVIKLDVTLNVVK
jgi:type II secretory pathway component GspD/PulD (secretin)